MKTILLLFLTCLFISVNQSARHRRQYNGYGYAPQYGPQYGSGAQGWGNNNNNNYNNMNNGYPNQQGNAWNTNNNWNQGNQRPEWYYNTGHTVQSSLLCFCLLLIMSILTI